MGCRASKEATDGVLDPLVNHHRPSPSTNPPRISRLSPQQQASTHPPTSFVVEDSTSDIAALPIHSPQSSNGFSNGDALYSTLHPNRKAGGEDPQWKELWLAHSDMLLDPADVHATLQDLMAKATNRFSDTELLRLQRRVRSVVRLSQNQWHDQQSSNALGGKNRGKKTRVSSGNHSANSGSTAGGHEETAHLAKNHHLLSEHALHSVLPKPPAFSISSQEDYLTTHFRFHAATGSEVAKEINIVETTYLLALFCNDILWDNVSEIAVDSSKANKLEMDVNQQIKAKTKAGHNTHSRTFMPVPLDPVAHEGVPKPLGVGMHALTFLLGLALRGSRKQQLNLLFYLLLPSDVLQSFLKHHPAGGFPTWLLEVDEDSVISLASLSHYYWYGGGSTRSPYLPSQALGKKEMTRTSDSWNQQQIDLAPKLSGHDVIHFLMAILLPEASMTMEDPVSPLRQGAPPATWDGRKNGNHPRSPTVANRKGIVGFKRRGSYGSKKDHSNKDHSSLNGNASISLDDFDDCHTDVSNQLKRQRQTTYPEQRTVATANEHMEYLNDYCSQDSRKKFAEQASLWLNDHPRSSSNDMTIFDFDDFCQTALDDDCIVAIMHRLFGMGWIPNPSMEKEMIRSRWKEWQESSNALSAWRACLDQSADGAMEILSQNVRRVVSVECENDTSETALTLRDESAKITRSRNVFGGLGGFDNLGGSGFGVMYCIDKKWWDTWEAYVCWSWAGDGNNAFHSWQNGSKSSHRRRRRRPGELSTEILLDRHDDVIVAGTLGSYELMKKGLEKDKDYVLVPPSVWDVLFELYAGGPPLPRMVKTPEPKGKTSKPECASERSIELRTMELSSPSSSDVGVLQGELEVRTMPTETDLDAMATVSTDNKDRVMRIPRLMEVMTHPWILQFQLCDPLQPYRKQDFNEAGPITIRVMTFPDQPLWRLYAELVTRLPFHIYRAYGSDGRGKVRLWKRTEANGPKDAYGPWPCSLLCKNRFAVLPQRNSPKELNENYDELKTNWQEYSDNATVEGSGLSDESQVLVEFAIMGRSNELIWPREAAAKMGRDRRISEKHKKFRRMLLGLNDHGAPMPNPPDLVGMAVDAREERSGRWYEVRITHVKSSDPDTDEENDDDSIDDYPVQGYKEVRVDFSKYGGRAEWIRIPGESGRLATVGRFTMGDGAALSTNSTKAAATQSVASTENKSRQQAQIKKAPIDATETTKVCTIPGYGACGLSNLGNTCYINSALQCIGYFPLVRSYLLSGEYRGDLNEDNPLGTMGVLLEEFVELLRFMWSSKAGEKSPFQLRKTIAKLRPDFAGADQQDAQELLSYVLDALMEDSNRVKKKPYVEGLEDDWVKMTPLPRVGDEAWRRERRRSRSIITDVHTGQTISTTTCPVCNFSSQKFDPFNLLSLPIPTVTDVIFKVKVIRRANSFNTPWVLNRPKTKNGRTKIRFSSNSLGNAKPPSDQLIVEQYIVAMSRLADTSDLRQKIQSICGIHASNLTICSGEEKLASKEKDDGSVVRRVMDLALVTNKKGPCSQFVRPNNRNEKSNDPSASLALIVAFESTLRSRPLNGKVVDESESNCDYSDEEDGISNHVSIPHPKDQKELERAVMQYGNDEECRLFDTDTLPIAQAVSRSLWPTRQEELKLGLRVDAIDHKKQWFPGSVVEILENAPSNGDVGSVGGETKVKIHFDNFSSKWDETCSIEHFTNGQVQPLYSHATPRTKPTEFIVHHRFMDRATRASNLFGQSFYVQCQSEWSTARAGAQILAQASRFLRQGPITTGPVDVDAAQEREAKIDRLYDRTQTIISELIDILVEGDRDYVRGALGLTQETPSSRRFRNPGFDATSISSTLVRRVNEKLHRLPFEVRVCTAEYPIPGPSNEECAFPFSLMRTIGNYLSGRHAIVLQWREPPSDKKGANLLPPNSKYTNYLGAPVMYVPPKVVMDETSAQILTKANQKAKKSLSARGSAGMPLGKCLTEFCKIQKLENDEGDTHWRCPRCKDFRPGAQQNLVLWRLPDILTIHMKRFRSSQKWREKITTKVNFPLTGLDMRKWCHKESPALETSESDDSYVYDLIGVINHYGGMTGGHYVATCKATPCSKDGREEVAFDFNGFGTNIPIETEEEADAPTSWKPFSRTKVEVNENKVAAAACAKFQGESVEPLWLQFDDEVVEPIAPKQVISDSAYVLFYRRRRLTPANVARYSSLD